MNIETLRGILKPAINDNERTRWLQSLIDSRLDGALNSLKDAENPSDINHSMAFAYFCPLSKHHKNPKILELHQNGFREWSQKKIKEARTPESLSHEHAWTICSLVPTFIWVEEDFSEELSSLVIDAFQADADAFRKRKGSGPPGNQDMACFVADLLYAQVTGDEEYYRQAREVGDAGMLRALADNGQVVEQYGPCPHYSYLAYAFCYSYAQYAATTEFDARLRAGLDWFRKWHTESLYLIPGASSRKYHVREMTRPSDIYSGLEYFSSKQPMYRHLLDRMMEEQQYQSEGLEGQILANQGGEMKPSREDIEEWERPFTQLYETVYFGRSPIKYALITRQYQTGITFTGFLPLRGIQTWAWGGEPPILHPVHDAPSTTQAWGIDTARFSCSHLNYEYGPGCMAADIAWREEGSSRKNLPDEPSFVVWRNQTLRSVAIFTDVSTVLIHTGPTGERITRWTLDPLEPAEPVFEKNAVRFEGRRGCIYSLGKNRELEEQTIAVHLRAWDPAVERNVQSLVYRFPDGASTAFAFSNESFSFLEDELDSNGILTFKDSSGIYRADISTIVDENGDLTYGLETAKIKRIGE
ncbi:MAG: hypothetical protein QGF00_27795 [Planctomycetota bacterium]|jgi:hypothetical protein|nr:hypothetical protein [Planctomycetota bacterium]MDP7253433.1 hypothetical protein [Planctomycetota bacterium]